jgi:hypothetical protein
MTRTDLTFKAVQHLAILTIRRDTEEGLPGCNRNAEEMGRGRKTSVWRCERTGQVHHGQEEGSEYTPKFNITVIEPRITRTQRSLRCCTLRRRVSKRRLPERMHGVGCQSPSQFLHRMSSTTPLSLPPSPLRPAIDVLVSFLVTIKALDDLYPFPPLVIGVIFGSVPSGQ